jgi:hypothetical protein
MANKQLMIVTELRISVGFDRYLNLGKYLVGLKNLTPEKQFFSHDFQVSRA